MTLPVATGVATLLGHLTRARLGETRDPRELVPGDPDSVHGAAEALRAHGVTMEGIGQGLARIDVPEWQGQAANAFWQQLAEERPKWLLASDAMAAGADVLRRHAEVLTWAQRQAADAIELWDRGNTVTEQARSEHNAAVAAIHQQVNAVTNLADRVLPVDVPQFFDPGAELRRQAEELLAQARQQVDESGQQAATALAQHSGDSPDSPGWLTQLSGIADTAIREHGTFDTKFTTGTEFDLLGGENKDSSGWKVKLAEWKHANSVWGWNGDGETQWGDATLSGSASLDTLGYEGTAELSISSKDGLRGELGGSAYLLHGEAEGSIEYGIAEVGAKGEVFVGAEAEAHLSAGRDGVSVGAEAFAGARAEGEITADVGGIGAGATGEAWVGYGAEASATFGRNEDGSFTIGGSAGAAFKAGGKFGFEVTVDPAKVVDTASSAAGAIGDFAGSAVDTVKFW